MDRSGDEPLRDEQSDARNVLLAGGAEGLARLPWRHPNEAPVDDGVLVRFALWRASANLESASLEPVEAGLRLLASARADLDTLETALLFTARAEGMTWAHIAGLLGLGSAQAAQQRFQRVSERPMRSPATFEAGLDD